MKCMTKSVPTWVISEFSSLSSGKIHDEIKDSVRKYVESEYGGEDEMNRFEGNLDARSTRPEDFEVGDTGMTVGDILTVIDELYDVLVEVNAILQSEDLSSKDVRDMEASEIENVIGQRLVHSMQTKLSELPKNVASIFAQHHHSGIGGYGNEPSIGPAGDAMKVLYHSRFKNQV